MQFGKRNLYIGVGLAIVSAIIWSGNFVIARGISGKMPPISTNFFRWLTATIFILPFAFKRFQSEKETILKNWKYFLAISFTCILLFNSFVYIAGHHTTAINLALIGTTSTPVFTIAMAAIFLKENVQPLRIAGLVICITGIIILISEGSIGRLMAFRFSPGDWWIIGGSFFFSIYNLLVKQKPIGISPLVFLLLLCFTGTMILAPFYLWESRHSAPIIWDGNLIGIVLYLGLGASFLSYLCWNEAIVRIGSSRTALFGNLIPFFCTLEAVLFLDEKIHPVHIVSGVVVITGLVIANSPRANAIRQLAV